jgi:predicted phage terminase large subunit-like protein
LTNSPSAGAWLDALTDAEFEEFERRFRWVHDEARIEQLTPPGEWFVWLLLAGRGFGKTRTAAEDVAAYGLDNPGSRIAVVAETFADGRDVCIEGESGLLSCLPERSVKMWNRSIGELFLVNRTTYRLFSGDKPDGLRGYQFHRAWVDELAKFRYARESWTQLMLGLRLGERPQAVVTTTPRPVSLLRGLKDRENTHVTTGSTFDNAANLAAPFLEEIRARYEGTRVGRQELYAEILDDVPGALWTRAMVDAARTKEAPDMERVVVAIDPAVTSGEDADETGLVVAGRGIDGRAYVLADRTCRLSPDGWAKRAVAAFDEFSGDRVVAEVNNGGDLVERVIRTVSPRIPYKKVHASRGKRVRAEPVAALYEQGKVKHAAAMPELEDQMCAFVPEGYDGSPDRVDALAWALTELMLGKRRTVTLTRKPAGL